MKSKKIEKESIFLFCVSKENGKELKNSSLTVIFFKLKDQKCLFQI